MSKARAIRTSLISLEEQHCTAPRSGPGRAAPFPNHGIVFVRRGVFVMHRGREQFVADPAQVLLFNASEELSFSHPQDGGDDCTVLLFSADAVLGVLSRTDPAAQPRSHAPLAFNTAHVTPELLLRLRRLRRTLRVEAPSSDLRFLAAEDRALRLLDRVIAEGLRERGRLEPSQVASRPAARSELAQHTKFLLASAPGRSHSLTDLARATASSPYQLARVFRAEVGVPIHQYLLRVRLNTALWCIVEGERHLSRLALDLGFSSHSHFSTAFRRMFGTPPASMRPALPEVDAPGDSHGTRVSTCHDTADAARCHCTTRASNEAWTDAGSWKR